jgi:Ca2+-transporting ATPase
MPATLSERRPFWRMTKSLTAPFWLALAGALAIQALGVYWPPLATVLETVPLSLQDWLLAAAISLAALALVESGKSITAARARRRGPSAALPS